MSIPEKVKKRNGRIVEFDVSRIEEAITKAATSIKTECSQVPSILAMQISENIWANFRENTPSIEDIQNEVERVLMTTGNEDIAKAYVLYRNKRAEAREKTKVRKTVKKKRNTTDAQLLVDSDSNTEYYEWDKSQITHTLHDELGISLKESREIAATVEKRIIASGVGHIGTSLIRELINNELFERGKQEALDKQSTYGLSKNDLEDLIFSKSKENSNISSNNPEAINFSLSETVLKKYALDNVFSKEVSDAHKNGLVHIHDLGHPTRTYCSGHSVEYIKKYGLKLGNLDTDSAPAKHARTLTGHINTFLASMQAYYAGALGLGAVNVLYAPYLEGMTDEEMYQEAQHLIFSCAQNAFSKGGQTLFGDMNVHIGIPNHLKAVPAIGPKGQYTGKTYGEYEELSNRFLMAMLKVWDEGDQYGHPMAFPKCHDKDTLVYCDIDGKKGIHTVEEIQQLFSKGIPVFVPHKDIKGLSDEQQISWIPVKEAVLRGKEEGICIYLQGHREIRVTQDHQFPVFRKDAVVMVMAKDIQLDDVLLYTPFSFLTDTLKEIDVYDLLKDDPLLQVYNVVNPGDKPWQKRDGWVNITKCTKENLTNTSYIMGSKQKINKLPVRLPITKPLIRIMAHFISNGSYVQKGTSLTIASKYESRTRKSLVRAIEEFNSSFFETDGSVVITNSLLVRLMRKLCPSYINHASQKEIPSIIFSAERDIIEEFVATLWHGDGTIKKDSISYSTSSIKLAYGLNVLLSNIGIHGSIYIETRKNYPSKRYYLVVVKGNKQISLMNTILKRVDMHKDIDSCRADTSWCNNIPAKFAENISNALRKNHTISKDCCKSGGYPEIFDKIIPVTVQKIEPCPVDAIAIEVDHKDHTFILANGILTKNCDVHIQEETFTNPEHNRIFQFICEMASNNGLPYFVFDRDAVSISMCCRLKTKVAQELIDKPELQNFCGFQNITVNLPQCAYRANSKDIKDLYREIDKALDICIRAHLEKKSFVSKLMCAPNLPLWEVGKPSCNGVPYVDLEKATYIVGIIGLNECVQKMFGKELHEGPDTLKKGLEIISYMYYSLKEYSKQYGLNFTLEESPAESASRRFARIDLKNFPESVDYVRGSITKDEIYYTNSVHLRADAPIDILERIRSQAKFHSLIESGAIIHAFVGEHRPDPKSIAKLVETTFRKTQAAQITISPEFTICRKCNKMIPGMDLRCLSCGSENIQNIHRVEKKVGGEWSKENMEKLMLS